MEEKLVFVKEAGSTDYDILYSNENVSMEQLHAQIKEALGRNSEIVKISVDGIMVRNVNGIKFMFKKPEPKLEVTFAQPAPSYPAANNGQLAQPSAPGTYGQTPAPLSPDSGLAGNKWLTEMTKPPCTFGHSGTCINNQLFVFGGYADETTQNRCLLLPNIYDGKFSALKVNGDIPAPRERHTATLIERRIYMFGGYDRSSDTYFNDVRVFDGDTLSWHHFQTQGNVPENRCGHAACYFDNKIFIFGGRVKVELGSGGVFSGSGVGYKNDLYVFDPGTQQRFDFWANFAATGEWLRYEPRGIGPSGRAMCTMTVVGRKIYIFGGANSTGIGNDTSGFCDLYELDVDTMTWSECDTKGTPPTPCYGHTATAIEGDRILIFGGKGYAVHNSINMLEVRTKTWKQYAFAGNPLCPRWGHSATLHSNGKEIVFFGGRDEKGYWGTVDHVNIDKQLIELDSEEISRQFTRREILEAKKTREAIGNLQNQLDELKHVLMRIGEELVNQKKSKEMLLSQLSNQQQQNFELLEELNQLIEQRDGR